MPEFKEGQTVETNDGDEVKKGYIVGVFERNISWPTGDGEDEVIEGSVENPVYIVAHVDGGSKPYRADEIVRSDIEGSMGDDEAVEKARELSEGAELSQAYWRCDEPEELEAFQQAIDSHIRATHVTELSQHRGTSEMYATELVNVPGVDDVGVGFESWPDSWNESERPNRLILLDVWASMNGTWRGCFREMSSSMTPRRSRRLCSAMKDEVYGTEEWRGLADT